MLKRALCFVFATGLLASTSALADHDCDPAVVARASYWLADDSEEMGHLARDRYITWAADQLHMEASDVYHVARRGLAEDHVDERIREEFQDVSWAYHELAELMHGEDHTLDRIWEAVRRDYANLYYAVYGFELAQE